MNVLIAHFSLGGTTRAVAAEVGGALRDRGHRVDLRSIQRGPSPDLGAYDVLGVAGPTHFFRPPAPVEAFIDGLTPLDGMPFFTIVLHGTCVGATGNRMRDRLVQKGGRDAGYLLTKGQDLWLGYLRRGRLFCPNSPTVDELRAARGFGSALGDRLAPDGDGGAFDAEERDPSTPLVYRLERATMHPWFAKHVYSRMFRATEDCIGCGECVEACPRGNVTLGADMRPLWGRDCVTCLSCELSCPEDAVRSMVDLPVIAPFMRYNIRRALADPDIESARVEFAGGTVRRLDEDLEADDPRSGSR